MEILSSAITMFKLVSVHSRKKQNKFSHLKLQTQELYASSKCMISVKSPKVFWLSHWVSANITKYYINLNYITLPFVLHRIYNTAS